MASKMNDKKIKMLAQLTLLIIVVALVGAWALMKIGYSPKDDVVTGFEQTFFIESDGRRVADTANGFAVAVPNLWIAEEDEVVNVVNLSPENSDVACSIELAHGKNVTGTSATGFLNYYDLANRNIMDTRDTIFELRDIQGLEAGFLGWTENRTSIRKREVYIPYQGFLVTLRYAENISPGKVEIQPVPCIRTFDDFLETGLMFP